MIDVRLLILLVTIAWRWLKVRADDAATVLERGRALAQSRCGICHAIGQTGESPHRISIPFRNLYQRYPVGMLVRARRTGVVAGHDEMPMYTFSRADIDALLTYIDSLSPGRPGYGPVSK